ncbi:hypothetical protein [Streptomyces sp. NBC_00286]|uniref:hypothetical protein n=1 Tax=Streptomyces sp. NBC_00286 TaxID=2975701 RepID=UPI002E2A90DC|nr:hypothetical protein [Streptomyces sp. NBC_00286]
MRILPPAPRRDRHDAPRDPEYGFFSLDEGAHFRAQVREAFAEHGLEVTVHAGAVSDSAGRHFGMANLAAICHNDVRGRKRWPKVIREHVGRLLQVVDGPSPLETFAPEQLLARLRPWVVTQDVIEPDAARYTHARIVAPGLCEVLALDMGASVMTLPDEYLALLGGVVDLRIRALDNLGALPVESHTVLRSAGGTRFDVVMGDSFFTASRALAMNELARDLTGRDLGPNGALVAMPHRHQLAFRPIGTVQDTNLVQALNAMTVFAAANFEDAAGQVSPHVYWWRRGALTQLVRHDGEQPGCTENGEFEVLLMWLVGSSAGEHS